MSRSLLASAGTTPAPTPTFDFASSSMGPRSIAYGQFLSLVAASVVDETVSPGFVTEDRESDVDAAALIPAEWTVRGDWSLYGHIVLAETPGGDLVYVSSYSGAMSLSIEVYSPQGAPAARAIAEQLLGEVPAIVPPEDGLSARFWYMTAMGPRSFRRQIEAPDWADIAGNYPPGVKAEVSRIAAWRTAPSGGGGRLMLAHGPPGTGKTFALRMLAREWRDWADIHVVTDPDEFFGQSGYMLSVLLDDDEHGPGQQKWRLVVIEDCDEILSANARDRSGHAVSRLLNVADGMVGQGLKVLLLLTTNETVDNFHQAIVRPGRCLSEMFFGTFAQEEANAWRAERGIATLGTESETEEGVSLAQLYAEERDVQSQRASAIGSRIRSLATD